VALYDIAAAALVETPSWADYRLLDLDAAATVAVLADRRAPSGPDAAGQFTVVRLRDSETLAPPIAYLAPPVLTPDGARLVWGDVQGLCSRDLATPAAPVRRPWELDPATRIQTSEDGRWLLTTHPLAHRLRLSDARTLAVQADLNMAIGTAGAFALQSPHLAVVDDRGDVRVWDIRSGQAQSRPLTHDRGAATLAYSRDGRLLATTDGARVLRLWHLGLGLPLSPSLAPSDSGMPPVYHPGSDSLILAGPGAVLQIVPLAAIR
jgi:WD40 repeat protein